MTSSALDVVHVLLPPDLHAGAASKLVERGLHVFVEKPMATTARECTDLIERATAHDVMVGVNHNFLFAPVYENLRRDLRAGKLGQPDHVTITWRRSLEQLHSGPFNLWMLRDPRNIVLEIGPHCLASMLDLVGPLEITDVRASNPMTLPGGREFYRRWCVEAGTGPVAVTCHFSFSPGLSEQTIHVRGSLASETVRSRAKYLSAAPAHPLWAGFRPLPDDFSRSSVAPLSGSASLGEYGLSKLKLSTKGNPYGLSITRAVQWF